VTAERINEFMPTDEARAILKALRARLGDDANKEFFDTWDAEISNPDAPRRAGSLIASAYMRLAARYGVLGADCAGRKPSLQLWLAMAEQEFRGAVRDVAEARVRCGQSSSTDNSPEGNRK
jgi:hypothetical protein